MAELDYIGCLNNVNEIYYGENVIVSLPKKGMEKHSYARFLLKLLDEEIY